MSDDEDIVECPYCGEEFESKKEEGVHRAEEHFNNNEENLPKPKRKRYSDENIVNQWSAN